jgi:hypothetical protein
MVGAARKLHTSETVMNVMVFHEMTLRLATTCNGATSAPFAFGAGFVAATLMAGHKFGCESR